MVTIVAAPNTRGVWLSNAVQYNQKRDPITGAPLGEDHKVGPYEGERFPRSRQIFVVPWDKENRRYKIGNLTAEDIQKAVDHSGFVHTKGPNTGMPITEANPHRYGDPFFSHPSLRIKFQEGEAQLDETKPLDYLLLECMKASDKFRSPDEKNPIKLIKGIYMILDKEADKQAEVQKMNKQTKAVEMFNNMNYDKLRQIGFAMTVGINDTTDPDDVKRLIYKNVIMNETNVIEGKPALDLFIELAEGEPESLNLKALIQRARNKGLIRKSGGFYTMYGKELGRTIKDIEAFLKDPENEMQLDIIRKEINDD